MNDFSQLIGLLSARKWHIAAAESCTAGLFSASIAQIPGASSVMEYGFTVYSVKAKCDLVHVSPETISAYGVVSEETAREMAEGAARRAGAEVGVGITGFAGPDAEGDVPVGRVCFGFCVQGRVVSETVDYGEIGRNRVREESNAFAAKRLIRLLEELPC